MRKLRTLLIQEVMSAAHSNVAFGRPNKRDTICSKWAPTESVADPNTRLPVRLGRFRSHIQLGLCELITRVGLIRIGDSYFRINR